MMTAEQWERANAQFLSDALAWLRDRLEQHITAMHGGAARGAGGEPPAAAAAEPATPARRAKGARAGTAKSAARAAQGDAKGGHVPIDAKLDPPPALAILGQRFGLTPFELDVLLLCVGFELDTRIAGLCARAHDDPARAYPTFALALTLFDDPSWDITSFERPLRRWRFIELERRLSSPMTLSPLRSDARIVDFVKGFNRQDDRVAALAVPLHVAAHSELPLSQRTLAERVALAFTRESSTGSAVVQLIGADTEVKLCIAQEAARQLGREAWQINASWLPTSPTDIDDITRLLQREAFLSPTLLVLDAEGIGDEREFEPARSARRLVSRLSSDVLILSRSGFPGTHPSTLAFDVEPPTSVERLAAWQNALQGSGDAIGRAPDLAAQFLLDIPTIERIARAVIAEPGSDAAGRAWQECCLFLRPRLDALAQRIDTKATWNTIVLPAEQTSQLRQIAAHVRGRYTVYESWGFAETMSRGFGISALFEGVSGTGKTMAAEVLANELRLPLYRIDLSAVVSKYIGETEKNLRQLFDAADMGGFILFFDEADALFGKRSEVRDSHDRYANIEVNYLLQRIEAYRGLAILATNAKAALDTAFVRRLKFIVNFPHPSPADRRRIWQHSFTAATPVEGVDFERLARFNATGGTIHSASLGAAFAATADGGIVTMSLILNALRSEYRKLNRPINEADFLSSADAANR